MVNKNNGYEIYDDLNNNITSFCINKFLEEYDYKYTNKDDFLFGTIINFAPEKITIHNYKNFPNKELLNTIEKVYGNNLIKCDNCILCKNI